MMNLKMESFPQNLKSKNEKESRDIKLENLLKNIANNLNQQFKKESGLKKPGNLIDNQCRLNLKAFQKGRRGGYCEEDIITKDQKKVLDIKENFGSIDTNNESVIEHYKNEYGLESEEDIKNKFLKDNERKDGPMQEMAITAMFYKILPDNYVTVRASEYDDYVNGIDNIVVDRNTGEAICTFDEVCAEDGSDRYKEKEKKIKQKIKKGGAKIKYGISYEDGLLKKCCINSLPAFNLRLSKNTLNILLNNMDYEINSHPTKETIDIFKRIVADFSSQFEELKNIGDKKTIDKMTVFIEMLENIKL